MFFESSILLGKDAMLWVTRMFEGEPILGKPYPALVSLVALVVFALLVIHAILAMRKFPADHRQCSQLHRHLGQLRHGDSTLWYVQVITGFALSFLAAAHLVIGSVLDPLRPAFTDSSCPRRDRHLSLEHEMGRLSQRAPGSVALAGQIPLATQIAFLRRRMAAV